MLFFLYLTNVRMDFDGGNKQVQFSDARFYTAMAAVAPRLPDRPESVLSQHAQRIVIHYCVGTLSHWTGLGLEQSYRIVSMALVLGIAAGLISLLLMNNLVLWKRAILYGIFFLNPYTVRPFILAPAMLADLVCVSGVLCLLWGIQKINVGWVLAGLAIGELGRHNMAPLSIAIFLWGLLGLSPRLNKTQRTVVIPGSIGIMLLVHLFILELTRGFAGASSDPPSILLSLVVRTATGQNDFKTLMEHFVRVGLPLSFMGTTILFSKHPLKFWLGKDTWTYWLLLLAFVVPVILLDPLLNQKSQTRYVALGVLIGVALVGRMWSKADLSRPPPAKPNLMTYSLGIPLMVGSLHHLHALNLWEGRPEVFTIIHVSMALIFGLICRRVVE